MKDWDDVKFILKRIHELQDYRMSIAICTRRTPERKQELIDDAKFLEKRFQERFSELQSIEKLKINGR